MALVVNQQNLTFFKIIDQNTNQAVDISPLIATYTWSREDEDSVNTVRSALDGSLTRERIAIKHVIEVTFRLLNADECILLLGLIKPASINASLLNLETMQLQSLTIYVNKPKVEVVALPNEYRFKVTNFPIIEY